MCCLDGQVLYTYDGQWQADPWSHRTRLLGKRTWWKADSFVSLYLQWDSNDWKFKHMRQFLNDARCHCAKTIGLMMMRFTSRAEDKRHGTGSCVRCHKVQAVECHKEICSRTSFIQKAKPFMVVLFQKSFKFGYAVLILSLLYILALMVCFGREPPIDLRTLDCATHLFKAMLCGAGLNQVIQHAAYSTWSIDWFWRGAPGRRSILANGYRIFTTESENSRLEEWRQGILIPKP